MDSHINWFSNQAYGVCNDIFDKRISGQVVLMNKAGFDVTYFKINEPSGKLEWLRDRGAAEWYTIFMNTH